MIDRCIDAPRGKSRTRACRHRTAGEKREASPALSAIGGDPSRLPADRFADALCPSRATLFPGGHEYLWTQPRFTNTY